MSILSDGEIRRSVLHGKLIIDPFIDSHVESASLDLTLDSTFLIVDPTANPMALSLSDEIKYREVTVQPGDFFTLEPGMFALASCVERIGFPADIGGDVCGRSSIGRAGLFVVNAAWCDPGFIGNVTLELFNGAPHAIKLDPGRRICQMKFVRLGVPAINPYRGKYQGVHANRVVGSRAFEDQR